MCNMTYDIAWSRTFMFVVSYMIDSLAVEWDEIYSDCFGPIISILLGRISLWHLKINSANRLTESDMSDYHWSPRIIIFLPTQVLPLADFTSDFHLTPKSQVCQAMWYRLKVWSHGIFLPQGLALLWWPCVLSCMCENLHSVGMCQPWMSI